jgi:hypothetical protein
MTKKPCHIAVIAVLVALQAAPNAVRNALANDETNAANIEFDSRERELRRKEEELLRAMDLNSAETVTATSIEIANPHTESLDAKGSQVQVLEVKAPEPTVEVAPPALENLPTEQAQAPQQRPAPLKDLEHHPALEPPRKVEAPPLVTSNRIRTKTSEQSPDGTTAKRLGSFYRIDRASFDSDRSRPVTHSQTVPIQQYSAAETVRPALLISDELATIQNSSTYLKTGPTRLDSSLVRMPRYTEVRIDYRSGNWYRVKTTGGLRGWVPGSALLFDADTPPRSAVRVGGVRNDR